MFPNRAERIEELQPTPYRDCLEMGVLAETEDQLFQEALDNLDASWHNQYILYSNVYGIEKFEKVLGIVADPSTESLEFRRARLLNRYSMTPPFTMPFLRQRLDEVLGEGSYSISIDYAQRILTISSIASNIAWAQEITVTITKLKPANLVFISKPLLTDYIKLAEEILTFNRINNYRLGVSWFLGSTPFATYENERVIKTPAIKSIDNTLLNSQAAHIVEDVAKVRVNSTYIITAFERKQADGNLCTLEYVVPATAGLLQVTRLELLNDADAVLTSSDVYIDNSYDVLISHKIPVKEGI